MNKVIVTKPFVGLLYMQVCAEIDATDEEILEVCNRENPSGTTAGWDKVIREKEYEEDNRIPIQCEKYPDRKHFLIVC